MLEQRMKIAFSCRLRHHREVRANSNSGITLFYREIAFDEREQSDGAGAPRSGSQITGDLGG